MLLGQLHSLYHKYSVVLASPNPRPFYVDVDVYLDERVAFDVLGLVASLHDRAGLHADACWLQRVL